MACYMLCKRGGGSTAVKLEDEKEFTVGANKYDPISPNQASLKV